VDMMEIGTFYNVVYLRGSYDIEYLNNVKCIKITPKSYRVQRDDGVTFLVPQDGILELNIISQFTK
jgi:hypothetical protein